MTLFFVTPKKVINPINFACLQSIGVLPPAGVPSGIFVFSLIPKYFLFHLGVAFFGEIDGGCFSDFI